jgi:DmsE family decaheme c-type cytochrome
MKVRTRIVLLILSTFWVGLVPGAEAAKAVKSTEAAKPSMESMEQKFHLKPGAAEKVCLTCHTQFEDILKRKFIHTPLKTEGCIACHNPHTSNFPKQLSAEVSKLCVTCHAGIMPTNARSTHKVALEGKCVQCHDPHASDNKNNLLKAGNELCYDCHKDKIDDIKKAKFQHAPVEQACTNCHNPHASSQAAFLLANEAPTLCKGCHDTTKPVFVKQHSNYPVANSKCTMCHNVHGSNKAGIIYDVAHKPFANKQCNQCHESTTSPNPLALKKRGFELCRGCHNDMVNDMFSKNRLHWPVIGKDGCLNCHNPHASTQQKLLKAPPIQLCGTCHADTIQRQEKSVTKHQPIKDGMCMTCHQPHASDNVLLLANASIVDLCGSCHDYMKHSTHPIGEKIIDKRNKNLIVTCLSCHRAHGTEFKKMIPFGTIPELCTQCHVEYQR